MIRNIFFNPAVYGIMWHMRTACCISKATNTLSEYVIPFARQLQQWLNKRSSILYYMDIVSLIFPTKVSSEGGMRLVYDSLSY